MVGIVFYSSGSGNTARLAARLERPAMRIPIRQSDPMPMPKEPYVLICPTYADGEGRGAVPRQVISFLNDPARRGLLCGVIAGGNRNFGQTFGLAGEVTAKKCNVPLLYKFELAGTDTDIARINTGLDKLTETQCSTMV